MEPKKSPVNEFVEAFTRFIEDMLKKSDPERKKKVESEPKPGPGFRPAYLGAGWRGITGGKFLIPKLPESVPRPSKPIPEWLQRRIPSDKPFPKHEVILSPEVAETMRKREAWARQERIEEKKEYAFHRQQQERLAKAEAEIALGKFPIDIPRVSEYLKSWVGGLFGYTKEHLQAIQQWRLPTLKELGKMTAVDPKKQEVHRPWEGDISETGIRLHKGSVAPRIENWATEFPSEERIARMQERDAKEAREAWEAKVKEEKEFQKRYAERLAEEEKVKKKEKVKRVFEFRHTF